MKRVLFLIIDEGGFKINKISLFQHDLKLIKIVSARFKINKNCFVLSLCKIEIVDSRGSYKKQLKENGRQTYLCAELQLYYFNKLKSRFTV